MKKYEIKFKHVVELEYTSVVYAESESEARDAFENDPFEGVDNDQEPDDEQGLSIQIKSVEEIELF